MALGYSFFLEMALGYKALSWVLFVRTLLFTSPSFLNSSLTLYISADRSVPLLCSFSFNATLYAYESYFYAVRSYPLLTSPTNTFSRSILRLSLTELLTTDTPSIFDCFTEVSCYVPAESVVELPY
jgi:hypothetical protein